jgi:hypothetical protein
MIGEALLLPSPPCAAAIVHQPSAAREFAVRSLPIGTFQAERPCVLRDDSFYLIRGTVGELCGDIDYDLHRRIWIGRQNGDNVVSSTTCAEPVPSEGTGGVGRSFAKERLAKRSITSAWAAGAGRISTDANASRQDRIELLGSDSFMFASLTEELGTGFWFQAAENKPMRTNSSGVSV